MPIGIPPQACDSHMNGFGPPDPTRARRAGHTHGRQSLSKNTAARRTVDVVRATADYEADRRAILVDNPARNYGF
jgi:hypothetical protein